MGGQGKDIDEKRFKEKDAIVNVKGKHLNLRSYNKNMKRKKDRTIY